MKKAEQLIDEILEKTNDKKQKQALEKIKDGLYPKAGWDHEMKEKAREYIQSSKILEK